MPLTERLQGHTFIVSQSGGWKPRIRVLVWSGAGEGPLPGLQTSPCSLRRQSTSKHTLQGLFWEGAGPSMGTPPHDLL